MTRRNNERLAEIEGKAHGTPSPAQAPSKVEPAKNELGVFSGEAVLSILKLIFAGSPLPEVLAIIVRLVESQAKGMFCTIWLPDKDEKTSLLRRGAQPSRV